MNKLPPYAVVGVLLVVGGCAFGYQARGTLSDVAGELRGKGYPGSAAGGGRFALSDRDGRLSCDGILIDDEALPRPGSCEGQRGRGYVRCSDGREIPVRWTAKSCRSFEGEGEDAAGRRLQFRVERNR